MTLSLPESGRPCWNDECTLASGPSSIVRCSRGFPGLASDENAAKRSGSHCATFGAAKPV